MVEEHTRDQVESQHHNFFPIESPTAQAESLLDCGLFRVEHITQIGSFHQAGLDIGHF